MTMQFTREELAGYVDAGCEALKDAAGSLDCQSSDEQLAVARMVAAYARIRELVEQWG